MPFFQSRILRPAAGAGLAAVLLIGMTRVIAPSDLQPPAAAEAAVRDWPKDLQALASVLIEQYGPPDSADGEALVWHGNGSWRKTVLRREGFTRTFLSGTRDHLEQVIAYHVPEDKLPLLKRFDRRLEANAATRELISRADREAMNFLALNLADDIVKGERGVLEARIFIEKALRLERAGKSSPYLEGFVFALQDPAAPQ